MPASSASAITSASPSESMQTTTSTSTFFLIRYRICEICVSISPLAFCTLTSAPYSFAVETNTSRSFCHLSMTKESNTSPICTGVSSCFSSSCSVSCNLPQPVSRSRHTTNSINLFFICYLPSLNSVGVTPTFFLKVRLK